MSKGVSNDSGVIENIDFGRYVFGTRSKRNRYSSAMRQISRSTEGISRFLYFISLFSFCYNVFHMLSLLGLAIRSSVQTITASSQPEMY